MEEQQDGRILREDSIPPGRLFLSVPETSVILDLDRQGRTVRRAIEAGEIPAIRVGPQWRIPVAWIRAQVHLGADGSPGAA